MPFSSGTFTRTFDCTTDRDNGVKILASKFDTEFDGIATGLSTCILKDGTQTCTAAIPFAEGLTIPDNKTIVLGTNSDITIQYDESTNDSLEIAANVEGAALGVVLKADQGDDNADQHKLNIADGGVLTLGSKISGSFVSYLTHTPNATVADSTTAVAGNLTVGGDLTLGSGAVINEAELEAIDGITAGTVAASKAVIVDSNKDITGFRNVTLTGELDAGSLDISGDADIDGTLEADAMTLNGTAITATATLDTGISNNNVPKFTSGVADDDFLRVDGTAIEGRSASEVLTDIAAMPLAGGAFSGDVTFTGDSHNIVFDKSDNALEFADNAKATFGAGSDLELSHNGTNSIIESKTGDLILRTAGTESIFLQDAGGNNLAQFNDNSDVKLYHNANEKLATSSDGIDVTGTVTSDGASLDGAVVINESSADVDFRIESNDQTHMLFVDAGNNNIGIKNSSPDTESVLDLGSGENTNHTRKLNIVNTGNSRAGFGALSNIFRMYYADDQAIQFGTVSRDGNFTFSEKARLHAGGAFSIGTDSAPSKFTVSNAGTDNIIEAANTSNSVRAGMQADTSVVGIGAITNHSVDFRTNATARMRLHSGGDLSLGTTTATGLFNLENGDNGEPVIQAKCTSTSFNHDLLKLICSRDGATTEYNAITVFDNNTDLKMLVRPDGDLENANNSYGGLSDQNLKENIVDAGSQWDDLKALRVRKYNLIGETATHIGVVAQEVEAAGMGGLVGLSTNTETQETHKSMKYSVLYMKAIKALQEAMTRIETLETQNTTQATQIADLITRVTALEAGG